MQIYHEKLTIDFFAMNRFCQLVFSLRPFLINHYIFDSKAINAQWIKMFAMKLSILFENYREKYLNIIQNRVIVNKVNYNMDGSFTDP